MKDLVHSISLDPNLNIPLGPNVTNPIGKCAAFYSITCEVSVFIHAIGTKHANRFRSDTSIFLGGSPTNLTACHLGRIGIHQHFNVMHILVEAKQAERAFAEGGLTTTVFCQHC